MEENELCRVWDIVNDVISSLPHLDPIVEDNLKDSVFIKMMSDKGYTDNAQADLLEEFFKQHNVFYHRISERSFVLKETTKFLESQSLNEVTTHFHRMWGTGMLLNPEKILQQLGVPLDEMNDRIQKEEGEMAENVPFEIIFEKKNGKLVFKRFGVFEDIS